MKILYIAGSYDLHIPLWIKYFAKKHEVYIFSDKKKTRYQLTFPDNVTIIEDEGYLSLFLNKHSINKQILRYADMLLSAGKYAKKINSLITKYDIDIVHAHSLYYGYLASFVEEVLPVVFTPMGSDIIIYAQKSVVHKYLAKKAFARADVITGDSKILQKSGYKIGAEKNNNFIIQNGVDNDIFFPKASNVRKMLDISEDTILLFSPRGLAALYNLDDIIRSLSILKEKHFRFKCMFTYSFGEENLKFYKKLVKELDLDDYVIWIGYVAYNDMPNYYNASDIVISVPSSDSSPKSVYEAMFCGNPVIVTDLPWCHEYLTNGEDILITEVNNYQQLADNIVKLIQDSELRQKLTTNAIKKANELYSYENNMIKMEEIMNEAINTYKYPDRLRRQGCCCQRDMTYGP